MIEVLCLTQGEPPLYAWLLDNKYTYPDTHFFEHDPLKVRSSLGFGARKILNYSPLLFTFADSRMFEPFMNGKSIVLLYFPTSASGAFERRRKYQ